MQASDEKFEVNSDRTQYLVSLTGRALAKIDGKVADQNHHSIEINLFRSYPYAGGIEVVWLSPIFHPNIRPVDGAVCIQLVNKWAETQTVAGVVKALKQLLQNPNPESPLNHEAASYYKTGSLERKGPRVVI